jgi:acyl-coenzyme A thioesterase 13
MSEDLMQLQIVTCTHDRVVCHIPVEKQHLNIQDRLFGGVTASLVDIGGSLAIAAKTASLHTGVSTDLSISYLRSAKLGDIVRYL